MRPARTCTVEGCTNSVHGNGLCVKHYKRQQRHGSTDDPRAPKPCAVGGCGEIAKPGRKGWCGKHYTRWHRYGDPLATSFIIGDDVARFWSKVSKDGPVPEHCPELGHCWPWTGNTDESGYGIFHVRDESGRNRNARAHRWLLGHLRGKPLTREVVGEEDGCHRCDNPPCCNPAHLYVGTRKQNIADAVERGRMWQQKVTHCPKCGAEYTYNPSGKHRRCKVCENAALRKTRRAAKTHCKNDHKLEGDNVIVCKNGTRKCRICEDARTAASAAALRARWATDPAAMTEATARGRWYKTG